MWRIESFIGVDPLVFGMTQFQVARLLDNKYPLQDTLANDDGTFTEYRGLSAPFCNYSEGKLLSISLRPDSDGVIYQQINLFNRDSSSVVSSLSMINGKASIFSGSFMFENIGLLLSSYFDEQAGLYLPKSEIDQDDRTVSVFARGSMDSVFAYFAEFSN